MVAISLREICKVYPGNMMAVHNFNLEVDDKEFIIFVVPSGCRKYTIIVHVMFPLTYRFEII